MKSILSHTGNCLSALFLYQIISLSLLIIAFTAFSTSLFAQGNTVCTAVIILPGSYQANGPTTGNGARTGCGFAGATHADWYKFTPVADGTITVSSCGSFVNTRLSIFTGTVISPAPDICNFFSSCVASDDDACLTSTSSQISGLAVTGGTTYYIQWDNKWSSSLFNWSLQFTPDEPVNNLPCDALPLLCGETLNGNSTTATAGGIGIPSCAFSMGAPQDLFYTFDAGEGNTYTVSVNGPDYDGIIALYTLGSHIHCNSDRTELACVNASSIAGVAETITFTATESKTILIQTYDWRALTGGEFNISLTCEFPNDAPCDATEVTCGQFTGGTTVNATNSSLGETSCTNVSKPDIFYKIQAIAGIDYAVTVNGTNYDGVLAAYTGSCNGTLTEIDCSDGGGSDDMFEQIHFSVEYDRTVYIRTYDYSSGGGDFGLQVACANLPYDEPCDARTISCGENFSGSSSGATTSSIGTPSCNGPYGRKDIFFKFYAIADIDYSVTVNGANYDALIAAYTGSCNALTEIDCANNGSQNGIAENLVITVSTDQFITLQIYDVITATGTASDYTITLNCPIPDNDDCVDAITLPVNIPGECPANQVQGTTLGSSPSNPEACEASSPDVYYKFNTGNNSEVLINLNAITAEDLVLTVFEASCSSEAIICSVNNSSTQIAVSPFTTYYARVHTFSDFTTGSFNICVEGLTPAVAMVNGTITGWNTNCAARNVQVSFYNTSALFTYIFNPTLSTSGTFEATTTPIPAGNYNVLIKVQGALAVLKQNVTLSSGANSLSAGPLILGDLNNNNVINVLDLSIFSASFGTTSASPGYNFLADLNCDGVINIFDVSILSAGFNKTGATI